MLYTICIIGKFNVIQGLSLHIVNNHSNKEGEATPPPTAVLHIVKIQPTQAYETWVVIPSAVLAW